MIQELTRMDLVRLLRGCEPGMEYVGMLQQHGLGVYVGGMNDHWEWTSEKSDHWYDVSEEDLWQLYTTITDDDRDEDYAASQVYVVLDGWEDSSVMAVFSDEETAEQYKDAEGRDGWVVSAYDFNPYFAVRERVWSVSLQPTTMEMNPRLADVSQKVVGYVQKRYDNDYLFTWVVAKNRKEAMAKANETFLTVLRGREQGGFRYLNQKIYIPDREFPNIKKYPFYDVASGKIVMGDFGAVLLPKDEALLPDGTPNPDLFILLDRHFVER